MSETIRKNLKARNARPSSIADNEIAGIDASEENYLRVLKSTDADAIFELAMAHEKGHLGVVNMKKGVLLYERAASLNHARANFRLGVIYSHGLAGEEDVFRARSFYERAVELGHIVSAFNLGVMHRQGHFGNEDLEKARHYYNIAIAGKHRNAMFNLAKLYSDGKFGEPEPEKAKELYEKAIALGDADSAFNLATMYRFGKLGAPDDEQAKIYYEKAVDFGSADAMNNLAVMHQKKMFKGASLNKAIELYKQSLELGNAQAAFNLALVYRKGTYVDGTRERIQELLQFAANLGHSNARAYLTNPMIKGVLVGLGDGESVGLRAEIESALEALEETFFQLRKKHLVSGQFRLAHFTTWPALESILSLKEGEQPRNCLRLYHVDYMNDPSEGHRLLSFKAKEADLDLKKAHNVSQKLKTLFAGYYFSSFEKHDSTKTLLPSVFTVSLTEASDRLDLWRAYGRDGAGFSMVLPVEQKGSSSDYVRNRSALQGFLSEAVENGVGDRVSQEIPALYWIQYSDDEVVKTLHAIAGPLERVLKLQSKVQPETWREVASCATAILLELLYLYKDEQYSTEREARALSVMRLDQQGVRPDERVPGRLYCETSPFLFNTAGSEIVLGPKAQDATAAMWNIRYRLTKLGFAANTIVRKSEVPYR
jgi:TPR repeat protein